MKAGILLRVSTEDQAQEDRHSIPAQDREIRAFCAREGYEVVAEYRAEGFSANKLILADLPALEAAVIDAEAGRFDALVIHEASRLARREMLGWEVYERLKKAGVRIVNISNPIDYHTPEGRAFFGIEGVFSAFWSQKIAEHVSKGYRERVRSGLPANRLSPGYAWTEAGPSQPPVVIEEEAVIIREGYARWNRGDSLPSIAAYFEAAGLKPRNPRANGRWQVATVRAMLHNPMYAGYVHLNGERFPGRHEAIVPVDVWERACEPRRRKPPRSPKPPLLLAGVATCADCGIACYQHRSAGDGRYDYYREPGSILWGASDCPASGKGWRVDDADPRVAAVLQAMTADEAWLRDVEREAGRVQPSADRERAALREKLRRIQREYFEHQGLTDSEYDEMRRAIQRDLDALPAEATATIATVHRLQSFASLWDGASPEWRNQVMRVIFRSVRLDMRAKSLALEPLPEFGPMFEIRRQFVAIGNRAPSGAHSVTPGLYTPADLGVAVAS